MKISEVVLLLLLLAVTLVFAAGGRSGKTLSAPPWAHCPGLHRFSQLHLSLSTLGGEKFNDPQGVFCVKLDARDDRSTKDDDDELTVFGLNRGNNTLIYNSSGRSVEVFGGDDLMRGTFSTPYDLSGDSGGTVFVSDSGRGRIVRLKLEGDEIHYEDEFDSISGEPLEEPLGICVSNGRVYISDRGGDRILVAGYDGTLERIIEPRCRGAAFMGPSSIAVIDPDDGWIYYKDHFIAAVDSLGRRLWKISLDGGVVLMTRYSFREQEGAFNHLDIDYFGNIYVTDTGSDCIRKYDRNLNYIATIGGEVEGEVSLDQPRGISINRRFGQVFVSERSGLRYFWIGTNLLDLQTGGIWVDTERNVCRLSVSFLLTEHSLVDLYLDSGDESGDIDLLNDYLLPGGRFSRDIEVPVSDPERIAKCEYTVVAVAKPTYSSGEYLRVERRSLPVKPYLTSESERRN